MSHACWRQKYLWYTSVRLWSIKAASIKNVAAPVVFIEIPQTHTTVSISTGKSLSMCIWGSSALEDMYVLLV